MPTYNDHPEQDPAEGSREVIERDLEQQKESGGRNTRGGDRKTSSRGSEAAEPCPE